MSNHVANFIRAIMEHIWAQHQAHHQDSQDGDSIDGPVATDTTSTELSSEEVCHDASDSDDDSDFGLPARGWMQDASRALNCHI